MCIYVLVCLFGGGLGEEVALWECLLYYNFDNFQNLFWEGALFRVD